MRATCICKQECWTHEQAISRINAVFFLEIYVTCLLQKYHKSLFDKFHLPKVTTIFFCIVHRGHSQSWSNTCTSKGEILSIYNILHSQNQVLPALLCKPSSVAKYTCERALSSELGQNRVIPNVYHPLHTENTQRISNN